MQFGVEQAMSKFMINMYLFCKFKDVGYGWSVLIMNMYLFLVHSNTSKDIVVVHPL